MKSLLLAVAVVLTSSAALAQESELRHQGHGPNRPGNQLAVVDRAELTARLERLEELLEEVYENASGRNRNKLRRAMEQLDDTQRVVANAPDARGYHPQPQPQPLPPPPPPTPAVQPIEQGKLNHFAAAMTREGFPREKLGMLRDFAPRNYFLVGQMRPLLEQFSFANDRLEAVRILWPRVLDRQNGFQLYEAFPFTGDKQKLRDIIGG